MAGYTNGDATKLIADDLLDSTEGMEKITIQIAPGTEDDGNPDGPEKLRSGLVLVRLQSGPNAGMFTTFNANATNGSEFCENAVILGYDVEMGDAPKKAMAYFQGTFRFERIYLDDETGLFDWNKVQRLKLRWRTITAPEPEGEGDET
jgi:hypothetical protein